MVNFRIETTVHLHSVGEKRRQAVNTGFQRDRSSLTLWVRRGGGISDRFVLHSIAHSLEAPRTLGQW